MREKVKNISLLHLSIFVFSLTGIFSKFAAKSIGECGMFSVQTMLFGMLMLLNCGIYAVFWQQNLKKFDVNVAYSHKAAYNIWSLCWAYFIFGETITLGNIIGAGIIIIGILVVQSG